MRRIRRAEVSDAEAIATLHLASWRTAYRGLFPDAFLDGLDPVEWVERRRRLLGENPPDIWNWVIELDARVVGWGATGPCREPDLRDASVWELYALYLDPGSVGQGVGWAVWERCRQDAEDRGVDEMILTVLRDNARARRFYRLAGFVDDDRVPVTDFNGAASVRMRSVLSRPRADAPGPG